jgi:hypothetical protein
VRWETSLVDLLAEIRAELARFPGTFAVYARNLSTGAVGTAAGLVDGGYD